MPSPKEVSSAEVSGPQRRSASDGTNGEPNLASMLPAVRQRLLRHARFALHDQGLAEDLVQDTLIAVVEQQAQRRQEASLGTWAIAILKHKVADWYRSPARERTVQWAPDDAALGHQIDGLYSADGGYLEAVPAWQQPENREEQRQMRSALERCVSGLPQQTGRVFMMREWLGFDNVEICDRLGLSPDNCRMILHRARMALRSCMQEHWTTTEVNG